MKSQIVCVCVRARLVSVRSLRRSSAGLQGPITTDVYRIEPQPLPAVASVFGYTWITLLLAMI